MTGPTISQWDDLQYWRSGEWQVVQEKLDALDRKGSLYNPPRQWLFRAMDLLPFDNVRIAIIGQDPYPNRAHACGVAFSVDPEITDLPPTLNNIFTELRDDLHCDQPLSGDLLEWILQGVFLWNAYPSCLTGVPGSHHWTEWEYLTQEIITELSRKGIDVFVFMGRVAQQFQKHVIATPPLNAVICCSHPSPLGWDKGARPFKGSRLFSTINTFMEDPIDWRL